MKKAKAVGVVGAGVMGTGLAQTLAMTGHQVVLVDRTREVLDSARTRIRQDLRLARMHGQTTENRDTVLARISATTDYAGFETVDFVVENITEDWAAKREVYGILDERCRADCVFAANTSVIPITRIGGATRRPDRVLGMHFMNPVPQKSMVEMIRGHHTTEATLATAHGLLAGMGKTGVVVADSPGFVSNRVLMLTVNEAVFLLHEGVADAEQVDEIFRGCFGHPMGPLATADLIGLDTILQSIQGLHDAFADSKYRPCPLLVRMVDAGLLGRKSGRGFFAYGDTGAETSGAARSNHVGDHQTLEETS